MKKSCEMVSIKKKSVAVLQKYGNTLYAEEAPLCVLAFVFLNVAPCFFSFFQSLESKCCCHANEGELCHLADDFEAEMLV